MTSEPRRRDLRQADLRLDDDFLDLPLAGGGFELDDEPASPSPPPPPPRRRPGRWLPALVLAAAAAIGAGWYLSLDSPLAAFSAGPLDFGDVRLGSGGAELSVEVENQGEKKLGVAGVTVTGTGEGSGAFSVTTDECSGREVKPQSACGLRVRFTPAAGGVHEARLEVASNSVLGGVELALAGNAVEPELAFEPARLDFGERLVGSSGPVARLWLENRGSAELSVGKIELGGLAAADFVGVSDECSDAALAPGKRCALAFRFVPTAEGLRRAEVSIRSDSRPPEASPWMVGIGLPRLPVLRVEPEKLELGSWLVGDESPPRTVTIRNEGDGPLVLRRLSTTLADVASTTGGDGDAGFEIRDDACSRRTVPPGGQCRVQIVFRPRKEGAARAFFEIEHGDGPGRHVLPAFATGTAPRASIDPSRLSFGEAPVAVHSPPRTLRVVNSGSGPMSVQGVAVEGADARAFEPPASRCPGATLEPGDSCSIELRFRPTRDGPHRAELVVRHSAGDGVHRLAVNGIGVSAKLTVEPGRLDLGRVRVTAEARQQLTLSNRGRAPVEILGIELRGAYAGEFDLSADRCSGAAIPPSGSCTVSVRFAPRDVGTRNAVVEIAHRGDGPREVQVTATAIEPPP
jgi:hypothetical protein